MCEITFPQRYDFFALYKQLDPQGGLLHSPQVGIFLSIRQFQQRFSVWRLGNRVRHKDSFSLHGELI